MKLVDFVCMCQFMGANSAPDGSISVNRVLMGLMGNTSKSRSGKLALATQHFAIEGDSEDFIHAVKSLRKLIVEVYPY